MAIHVFTRDISLAFSWMATPVFISDISLAFSWMATPVFTSDISLAFFWMATPVFISDKSLVFFYTCLYQCHITGFLLDGHTCLRQVWCSLTEFTTLMTVINWYGDLSQWSCLPLICSVKSEASGLLRGSCTKQVIYGDWAFLMAAPTLWNPITAQMRNSTSISRFKMSTKDVPF